MNKDFLYGGNIEFREYIFKENADKNLLLSEIKFDNSVVMDIKKTHLERINKMFEKIDSDEWHEMVVKKIRMYDHIKYVLRDKGIKHVSNGWMKLLEMLVRYDFIDKNVNELTSVHMCEAPGSWIVSFQNYLNNFTNVDEHIWYAQSLNPNCEINKKKYGDKIFSDDYNLMKNFPQKWIFGKTGTGDITDVENIIDYKKNLPDKIDFISFDCGLNVGDDEDHEKKLGKIFMANIILVLSLLSNGGSFVSKTFIPISSKKNLSLLYILYCSFDKFLICKPLTSRPHNQEIYLIGVGYNGFNEIEFLINKFRNYDEMNITNVSDKFLKEYKTALKYFCNEQYKSLERTKYFYDNRNDIKSWDFLKAYKKRNLTKWLKTNLVK